MEYAEATIRELQRKRKTGEHLRPRCWFEPDDAVFSFRARKKTIRCIRGSEDAKSRKHVMKFRFGRVRRRSPTDAQELWSQLYLATHGRRQIHNNSGIRECAILNGKVCQWTSIPESSRSALGRPLSGMRDVPLVLRPGYNRASEKGA